eukprot:TRINITY_DN3959_c0_g1_i1.p2 TRINITY_DN3959_c0_g1~~TRINITY_DN3959_c0_g1_i1.p2  ORF type:complete len:257 (+),score=65.79 TRINITY_DN3959_c0_g1_i1:1413-2183(+)
MPTPAEFNILAIVCDRGPLVLLRLDMGRAAGVTPDNMITFYLSHKDVPKCLKMLRSLDSGQRIYWYGLSQVVHTMQRHCWSQHSEEVLKFISDSFPVTDPSLEAEAYTPIFMFAHFLLRQCEYELAFKLAKKVMLQRVWQDVAVWCDQHQAHDVALAARPFITSSVVGQPRRRERRRLESAPPTQNPAASETEVQTLQQTEHEGGTLSPDEASRLGIYLEGEGQYAVALALYAKYKLTREWRRLQLVSATAALSVQ